MSSPRSGLNTGSPPRAWGRLIYLNKTCYNGRFTPTCVGTAGSLEAERKRYPVHPTCVGTACLWTGQVQQKTVHPHVRGDGAMSSPRSGLNTGSPPRAWGRLIYLNKTCYNGRFTPTCVGTAIFQPRGLKPLSVHPHVRGDGATGLAKEFSVFGSPPRAWGRRRLKIRCSRSSRFTPTCVGTAPSAEVHP